MLKRYKTCKVCIALDIYPSLINDIYNSTAFMKNSPTSLLSLHEKYKLKGADFSYESLKGHCKKHQFMDEADFNARHLRQIANQAEKQLLKKAIQSKEVWDEVIDQGMDKLKSGELSMKTADLLKAAKDKSDYEMKANDQQLAMMEMMWHFASGEDTKSNSYDKRIIEGQTVEDFDATARVAGYSQASPD